MSADSRTDILLVGPYPPPIGGVSTHVERLARLLEGRGVNVAVANHFGGRPLPGPVVVELRRNPIRYVTQLSRQDARIVHYHHSRIETLVAVALVLATKGETASVATVHGRELGDIVQKRGSPSAQAARWALRRFDVVVAVSDELATALRIALPSSEIVTIPAFIPAPAAVRSTVSGHAGAAFIERPGALILAAAYRISFDTGAFDDYGLDIAVDLFLRIAPSFPEARLALFLAIPPKTRRQKSYLRALLDKVRDAGVSDRVAVLVGEPLVEAFRSGSVLLRPTRTEGDAVSIREALLAGIPVIASDIVRRPAGTIAVELHDMIDWEHALVSALTASEGCAAGNPATAFGPVEKLMTVYAELADNDALRTRLSESHGE